MKNTNISFRLPNAPITTLAAAIFCANVTLCANTYAQDNQARAMETVTVTAQASNARSDLDRQRDSNKLVAVQTSDAIGELPDANVTEALQRMPGVFIARDQGEGRFVGVRGIDPNLNAATINGVSLPAPETDSRAVALDVIPSDLLASLEVFKTLTPDMSADSIGGAIEIKSINALDYDGSRYKFSVENSYSDLQEEHSPKYAVTMTNVFDLEGDRRFGIALAVSHQERDFGSENIETDGSWGPLVAEDGSEGIGATEIEQRDYTITRERTGVAANFDLELSSDARIYLHSLYSDFSDQEIRQRNSWKLDAERDEPETISRNSAIWDEAALEKSLKDRLEEQEIISTVLGGEHNFEQWGLSYALGYSHAEESEPHRRDTDFVLEPLRLGYVEADKTPRMAVGSSDAERILDPANYQLDELVIEDNFTEDEELSVRLDFSREIEWGDYASTVQFGLHERQREKSGDLNASVYDGFGGDFTLADFVRNDIDYGLDTFGPGVNPGSLNSFINRNIASFELDETETALSSARDYKMQEDISALYVMNTIELDRTQWVFGVRYEHTDFSAEGMRVIESEEPVPDADPIADEVYASAVNFQRDYDHFFPSVNFKFDYSDNIVLRAAYTESLSRPSFGHLNPSPAKIEYDDGELEVEAGNPNLQPYESRNLDISAEYYADHLGMFSLGLFHKDIDNFIVMSDVSLSADLTQYIGNLAVKEAEVMQPINGDSARINGAELAWTRGFDNGFLLRANATLTDSEARLGLGPDRQRSDKISLPSQADLVGNFIVGYERDAFSLRLSAAFRSEQLLEVDMEDASRDRYEEDHLQLDLSARYHFSNGLQLTFTGVNLTDEPYYVHNSGFNGQYEEYGPTYALGLSYSTF
ncbi:TonB-dependent receptor [Microbulbifer sp. THAF38]|uniref:TonB-dependent receptor n=1 Tax=Microbulbifer sp. THAF38 TaxID=2587856 RepID=UPI0012692D8B|nr:TonB-dependent receptor [Microbulbifer sp. THAF38]QFT56465.1 catecholate siderophore receptor CirA [Microbulbifer sp. THAF38]